MITGEPSLACCFKASLIDSRSRVSTGACFKPSATLPHSACRTFESFEHAQARAEQSVRIGAGLAWHTAMRKEQQATTVISRSIGISLQQVMHQVAGDEEAAQEARAKNDTLTDALADPKRSDAEVLLASDESIALEWVQRMTVYGEREARTFLEDEVLRLSQVPGFDPCPH